MKEYPILFSAPMVRAILEGRKTQTRRIIKPQPDRVIGHYPVADDFGDPIAIKCPHGAPGDRIWVRETWRPVGHNFPIGWPYEYRATSAEDMTPTDGPWKPSIHMPRKASRILLEIVAIRCERLQAISEEDAIAEGVDKWEQYIFGNGFEPVYKLYGTDGEFYKTLSPVISYASLWESINGPGSYAANPFVWVIQFKVIEK